MVNDDLSIFSADPVLTSLRNLSMENLWSAIERCVPQKLLDTPIPSYRMSNLRYSPRKKMIVGLTSNTSQKPISLRIFPRGSVHDRLAKAQRSHPDHTFLLDDLNAIAWVFPGERKLDLSLIDNTARLATILKAHRGYELSDVKLMHFVPEHTYTARVFGRRRDGSVVCEYIKIYYDDQGATTARIMNSLAPKLTGSAIRIPDDISYIPEHRLLVQSEIRRAPKQSLSHREAAVALAAFHELTAEDAPVRTDNPQAEHQNVLEIVDKVFPGLINEIREVSESIVEALELAPHPESVLVHGDAHLGNLFPIAGRLTGVIDLDRVAFGRADDDLASFLAFKAWLRLRDRLDPDLVLWELPQFVATYNNCAKRPVRVKGVYQRLAHKMIVERVRRGITRGKVSDASEILGFLRIARLSLEAARRYYD